MTTNNYDASSALTAYYPDRTTRTLARHWSREKVLHDWTDLGAAQFFEGPGDDPTSISGYALNKLWLRVDAGVTTSVGTVRYFAGGNPALLASWPVLNRPGFSAHIGAHGGNFDYAWSTSTSGDPGTGKVLANNATLASATAINISKTGRQGQSYAARIATWDDSTTLTNRGRLVFYSVTSAGALFDVRINGAVVDNSTYYTVPVAVLSSGSIANADLVGIAFHPTGDKGQDGAGSVDLLICETRTDAAASIAPTGVNAIQTLGYAAAGDGGGAYYVPKTTGYPVDFTTSDAREWMLDPYQQINPRMFGAVGDAAYNLGTGAITGTDDTAAIQAAVDYQIFRFGAASSKAGGSVHIGHGAYRITAPIQVSYGATTAGIDINGDGRKYFGAPAFTGTAIFADFNDEPAFAISGARRTTIRNMTLMGKNYNWITDQGCGSVAPAAGDLDEADWVDTSFPSSSSSRYAPYAGIAIDPYDGTAPATAYPNVSFPAWSGISTQYGKAPSSQVVLENVGIHGFVAAIAIKPSNDDGNAEYTKIIGCDISYNVYGMSVGHTQSRVVHIEDCAFAFNHTHVTTGTHGLQLGKPNIYVENCELGACIRVGYVPNMTYGCGVAFKNCYGEVVYRLGDYGTGAAGNSAVMFEGCEFQFNGSWDARGRPVDFLKATGSCGVILRQSSFGANGATIPNILAINARADAVTVEACNFTINSASSKYYEKHVINATGGFVAVRNGNYAPNVFSGVTSTYYNLNTGSAIGDRVNGERATISKRNTGFCLWSKMICAEQAGDDYGFNFKPYWTNYSKSGATVSAAGTVVTVTLSGPSAWQFEQIGGDVGDIVYDDETGAVFFVRSRSGTTLTLAAQTGYDASGNMLTTMTASGNLWAMNCRLFTMQYVTEATLTSGNPQFTAVQSPHGVSSHIGSADNGVQVDDMLYVSSGSAYRPIGPNLSKINTIGATTLTFDDNAGYSDTRHRLQVFVRKSPANNT